MPVITEPHHRTKKRIFSKCSGDRGGKVLGHFNPGGSSWSNPMAIEFIALAIWRSNARANIPMISGTIISLTQRLVSCR